MKCITVYKNLLRDLLYEKVALQKLLHGHEKINFRVLEKLISNNRPINLFKSKNLGKALAYNEIILPRPNDS